jgi:NADH:ubiquinone oxidoreductase subunit 4 (subunit M)
MARTSPLRLFFDLMLVPIYFLDRPVGQGTNRGRRRHDQAGHLHAGRSLLMLAAAVRDRVLIAQSRGEGLTFALRDLVGANLSETTQNWLFLGFALPS